MNKETVVKIKSGIFDLVVMFILALFLIWTGNEVLQFLSEKRAKNFRSADYWADTGVYPDRAMARALYKEYLLSRSQYVPFVQWTAKPISGQFINVDASGHRRTVGNSFLPRAKKIYFFGGSTAWGVGVDDQHTIPSLLSQKLNERSAFAITNYGQGGYFSTQEAVSFLLETLKQDKISLSIFFDGFNENYIGGYSPGDFFKIDNYETWLERQQQQSSFLREVKMKWRNSPIYFLFVKLHLLPSAINAYDENILKSTTVEELAERVVTQYLKNVEVIHSLARAKGIEAHFFWQPCILSGTKKVLSPKEKIILTGTSPLFRSLVEASYRKMDSRTLPAYITNISHVLDDVPDPLYIDFCHVGPLANDLIAKAIAQHLK